MKHLYFAILFLFLITACGSNETEDFGALSGEEKNMILTSSQSEINSLETYLKDGTNADNFTITPLQHKGYSIIARTDRNIEDEVVQENANRICNKIKTDSEAFEYEESQNHGLDDQGMGINENGNFSVWNMTDNGTYFSSINCVSN